MINHWIRWLSMLALCAATGLGQAQDTQGRNSDASHGPVEIVRETTDELYRIVNANRETYKKDIEKLENDIRDVLLPHVDKIYSARLILGRHGRNREREKIVEFADALSELLLNQYAEGLLDFKERGQVEIRPLRGDNTERMTRVKTRVELEDGDEMPVDYVFRKTDEGWKIYDVIVEGVSYVTTFRNQIGQQIREQGFEATLKKVKRGNVEVEVAEEGNGQ